MIFQNWAAFIQKTTCIRSGKSLRARQRLWIYTCSWLVVRFTQEGLRLDYATGWLKTASYDCLSLRLGISPVGVTGPRVGVGLESASCLLCSALSQLTCGWNISPWWIRFQLLGRSLLTDLYLLARVSFSSSHSQDINERGGLKLGPMSSSEGPVRTYICLAEKAFFFLLNARSPISSQNVILCVLVKIVSLLTLLWWVITFISHISDTSMLSRLCAPTSCVTWPQRSSQTRMSVSVGRFWRIWWRSFSR